MDTNRRLFFGSLLLLFIISTTVIWGEAIGIGIFIANLGIKALPPAIILEAFLSMVFIANFEQLKAYTSDAIILASVCLLGVLLLLLGRHFVLHGSKAGYVLYYAAQRILCDVLLFYAWHYIAGYSENYTRTLMQRLHLTTRILFIFSGVGLTLCALFLTAEELVWLWIAGLLANLVAVGIFADEFQNIPHSLTSQHKTSSAGAARLGSAVRSFLSSPIIRLMSINVFCMMLVLTLVSFKSMEIFAKTFTSDIAFIRWLGIMSGLASFLTLPIHYGLLPGAIQRNNLQRVIDIFPLTLGSSLLLIFALPILLSAMLTELTRSALKPGLYDPLHNQMRNTLPSSIRFWAHTILDGVVAPLGQLMGGVLLLLMLHLDLPILVVPIIGLAIVGVFGYTQNRAGKQYLHILETSLADKEYNFLRNSLQEQLGMNKGIIQALLSRLSKLHPYDREILLIAEALAESDSQEGFYILRDLWSQCPLGFQTELLQLLTTGWQNEEYLGSLKELVSEALDSPSPALRQAGLRALGISPRLMDTAHVAQFLIDPNPTVSAAAAQLLLQNPLPLLAKAAYAHLNWLSKAPLARTRALAVTALVNGGTNRFAELVVPLEVERLQADSSAHVRMSLVPILDYEALTHSAQDVSPSVRQLALKRLKQRRWLSTRHLQQKIATSRAASPQNYQIRATQQYWHLLIALGTINPRFSRKMLLTEIILGLHQIDYLSAIGKTLNGMVNPALAPIIAQIRHDRAQLLRAMLNFMAACYGAEKIRAITRALQLTANENGAQLARQTLVDMTNPQIADQLNTLLTSSADEFPLVTSAAEWQPSKSPEVVRTLLSQDDDWFPLLSLYGLSLLPPNVLLDQPVEQLLERCRHSQDDAIREGARLLKNMQANEPSHRQPEEGHPMLSTIERMFFLRNVAFFENLRLDQLRTLARICVELSVNEGEFILRKGEAGDSLFVVVEGEIKIFNPDAPSDSAPLAIVNTGNVIGEISLFDGGLRSADAVATKPTLLLVVYRDTLDDALADDPGIALDMLRAMAQLIRAGNTSLARLSSQMSLRELSEDL